MKSGDFTNLAYYYGKSRPGYSDMVLDTLLAVQLTDKKDLQVCDLGAGTGIWTRQLVSKLIKPVFAVEPNEQMLSEGMKNSENVIWSKGSAEKTNLQNSYFHWVTMASSFHWADFDMALDEISRILQSGGCFTALWNPRVISINSKLNTIEEWIKARTKKPRISSGNSEFTQNLESNFKKRKDFRNFLYVESDHSRTISKEEYINAWKSVNDIRVSLGEVEFKNLIGLIDNLFEDNEMILNDYKTKSWSIFKR